MVYRSQLTYDEIVDVLDVKNISGSSIGYRLQSAIYEISHVILMLKSLLPNKVKVNFTIDNIRLKSKLNNTKTISFTKKSFLFNIFGFTQSHLVPLVLLMDLFK